ncbi:MAG: T9SS type A sorting domain-containing protein, partial [Crocinitomicaceae bacterium]|nr:T9SS type A sorting domain-containing protein [Crocinitomicaceae bacterium]
SGCVGSTAYTLVIDCPINGASLASFPPLCDNDAPYIMSEGSPSGGSYSGTGVTGSSFDPAAGTQLITYSLVDIYACPQSASATITVNTAPTVTLASFNQVCEDDAAFMLIGGSPLGGTYSGTGVSGGNFDPANSGTFTITYDYTDGNGCSNAASADISVVSCLGTGDLSNEFNFKTYPNPTNGMFTIKFDLPQPADVSVKIISADGKTVFSESLQQYSGFYGKEFYRPEMESGVYIIELNVDEKIIHQHLIMQ